MCKIYNDLKFVIYHLSFFCILPTPMEYIISYVNITVNSFVYKERKDTVNGKKIVLNVVKIRYGSWDI